MPSINLTKIKTYPLASRRSKVRHDEFAKACVKGLSFAKFYSSLPNILAVKNLRILVDAIVSAHRKRKPVLWMMGAHVIKVGLNPLLIQLIRRRIVTAVALNGAGIIHDFELSFMGQTSEDVAASIADGSFGMARETSQILNAAIKDGAKRKKGLGESVGEMIVKKRMPYRNLSILAACFEMGAPVTVHVAIGTDIIHQQPVADGAAIGQTSLEDFRKLVKVVSGLGQGGVVGNIGSNVILPEVFLKAISVSRNLGYKVKDFTAFDLDMVRHYRPTENVLKRPTMLGGQAISITGHHEILVPLIAQAVIEELG